MNIIQLLIDAGLITDEQADILRTVLVEDLTGIGDESLQEAADILHAVADLVLDDADNATDDHIAVLEGAADELTRIGAEQEHREEIKAERRERLAALGETLRGSDEPEPDPETVEPIEAAADDDDDEGGDHVDPVDATDDDPEGAEPEREPEPVTAAAPPRVGRVAARRPTRFMPQARPEPTLSDVISEWNLVASANNATQPHGRRIETEADLADAFVEAWRSAQGFQGPTSTVRLFSMGGGEARLRDIYPEDRILGIDPMVNSHRIGQAQAARSALVASGGNPAPEENRYDIPVVGIEARPVRDSFLTRFGATRGGINVIAPPRLADLDDATSVHTNANDVSGASKSVATVTAGAETQQLVAAIVKRIRYGEFQERYLPELIAAWVRLAAVSHARLAEQTLVTSIASSGRAVSAGEDILSATRDILAQLDRLVWAVRSRERLGPNFAFDVLLPDWCYGLIRSDLSRQVPGGGTVNDETLAVTDAAIDRFFATRSINPVWSPDMQVFTEQGVGAIQGWPDTVVGHVAPSGGHLFLDGGSLNLGIVRDSTLNDTNDVEMFAETFEEHIYHHQVPAYQITMDVDPSGTTSAAAAFNPAVTGS